jgi:hypothetical protein
MELLIMPANGRWYLIQRLKGKIFCYVQKMEIILISELGPGTQVVPVKYFM